MRAQLKRWTSLLDLGAFPSSGLREALQWLMMARLGVLYLVLSVVALQQIFRRETISDAPVALGYGLLAVSFAFNLVQAMFVDRLPSRWWVAGVHVVFDATMTSLWIVLSKSHESLFALLYLIQILINALVLYQKGALSSSLVSTAAFGIVVMLSGQPNGFLTWGVYTALFLTLGVIGGYLSEELLRTTESLKHNRIKMEKIVDLHEQILSDLPTGLLTVDNEMRINFINPAGEQILGHHASEIVGRALNEAEPGLMPFFATMETETVREDETEVAASPASAKLSAGFGGHRPLFAKGEKGSARLQQSVEIVKNNTRRILRGDVAQLEAEAGMGRLLDREAAGGRVLLFQDVTALVHLEEKLRQSEKLAAVGKLAAGIAHEIRNPLASMSASIEMLKGSLPPSTEEGAENQKLMEIAIREIDRLNGLVSEFLDFVKPEKFRFQSVDLKELLSDLVVAVQRTRDFKERVKVREAYQEAPPALGNADKLKQVAWNLLVNAVQAMDKAGTIEVGVAPAGEGRVKFWVGDEGQGMSEEVLSHLYEPFFTTKDRGTGLGLATAYKIIEAHHGEIKVTSKVNAGTKFEIFLQRAS